MCRVKNSKKIFFNFILTASTGLTKIFNCVLAQQEGGGLGQVWREKGSKNFGPWDLTPFTDRGGSDQEPEDFSPESQRWSKFLYSLFSFLGFLW